MALISTPRRAIHRAARPGITRQRCTHHAVHLQRLLGIAGGVELHHRAAALGRPLDHLDVRDLRAKHRHQQLRLRSRRSGAAAAPLPALAAHCEGAGTARRPASPGCPRRGSPRGPGPSRSAGWRCRRCRGAARTRRSPERTSCRHSSRTRCARAPPAGLEAARLDVKRWRARRERAWPLLPAVARNRPYAASCNAGSALRRELSTSWACAPSSFSTSSAQVAAATGGRSVMLIASYAGQRPVLLDGYAAVRLRPELQRAAVSRGSASEVPQRRAG